jgi:hypothetical protein
MLILKVLSAVTACALGAAAVLAFPGFSPEVEAGIRSQAVKGDRLDSRPLPDACLAQTWPYIERGCLRGSIQTTNPLRQVRVITLDRLAAK